MKATVTIAPHHRGGGAIRVVIDNPERKFDGEFELDLLPVLTDSDLVSRLRKFADDIENYATAFTGLSANEVAMQAFEVKNTA